MNPEAVARQDLHLRVTKSVLSNTTAFQWNQLPDIPDNLKPHYGYILQVRDSKTRGEVRNFSFPVDITQVTVNLQPGSYYSFLLKAYRSHRDVWEATQVSGLVNANVRQPGKEQGDGVTNATASSPGMVPVLIFYIQKLKLIIIIFCQILIN